MRAFEIDDPGFRAAAVRIESDDVDYWIARFDHTDERIARTWSAEVTVAMRGNLAVFGTSLVLSTREEQPEFQVSIPGVVRQVALRPGLSRDGRTISTQPWVLANEADVERLVTLIVEPGRLCPVIVISLDEGESDPGTALVSPYTLAERCIGIAHVAVISGPLSFSLSDLVGGKTFSTYRAAVRTYRPGCDFSADSQYAHPLFWLIAFVAGAASAPRRSWRVWFYKQP
jgi:hypothetical protein